MIAAISHTSHRRVRWTSLTTVLILLAGLLAGAAFNSQRSGAATTPVSTFTKTGTDTRNNSTTDSTSGSTGTARPGDTINWVLNYANNTGSDGNVNITDPINAGQTYVPGSLQAPPGMARQYSTDGGASYSNTEPGSGVNAVGATGTVASGGASARALAPQTLITANVNTGDGWETFFYGDEIYIVHHHHPALTAASTLLDCFNKFTGVECPGYGGGGVNVNSVAGTPFFQGAQSTTASNVITPTMNFGYLDRRNGHIYIAATLINSNQTGVQCLNVANATSCGFTNEVTTPYQNVLDAQGNSPTGKMTGGAVVGSNFYTMGADGRIYCFDLNAESACAGWTPIQADPTRFPGNAFEGQPGVTASVSTSQVVSFGGTRLWVATSNIGGDGADLSCVDLATGALCPGYPKVNLTNPDARLLAPVLDTAGNVVGGCLIANPSTTVSNFDCFDGNGAALADPYPQLAPGWVSWRTEGGVIRVGAKVYLAYMNPNVPNDATGAVKYACYDFATGAACAGFNSPTQSQSDLRPYTLTQDPYAPSCLWEDGDGGRPQSFNATTGALGCPALIGNVTSTPASNFCDGSSGHVTGWDAVHLDGITSNQYSSSDITITDPDGTIVPGWDGVIEPNSTQTIDISSISVAAHPTLVVRVGILDPTAGATATIRLSYAGDNESQICYQTQVDNSCPTTATAQITDVANAVTVVPNGASDSPTGNSSGSTAFNIVPTAAQCSLHVQKRVSDSTAQPGQTVTWRLDIQNTGSVPYTSAAPATWSDDLSAILDDAAYNNDAAVTAGPGSVSFDNVSNTLAWSGPLAVNQTATVTFTATVDATARALADHNMPNTVVSLPSSNCAAGSSDPDCATDTTTPNLLVAKISTPTSTTAVNQGDLVTYQLTFDNSLGLAPAVVNWTDDLSGVLDDANLTGSITGTGGLIVGAVQPDGTFAITGTVPASAINTVTYSVRVDNPIVSPPGNYRLDNYLIPTGTNPPSSCVQSDPRCTTNPVPDLQVEKTSSPSSGTPVNEGDTVLYQLTFDNSLGQAPANVSYTDDMTDDVDDGQATTPTVSGGNLTITPTASGFDVQGTLGAGQTAAVIYRVTVDQPDNGNHVLNNYLVPRGTNPPSNCQPSSTLCTTNPIPDLIVAKLSTPTSTTAVNQGDRVDYTLSFDNTGGKAPADVDWTDHLSDVLDDAALLGSITAGGGLTAGAVQNDDTFRITGTVPAGELDTVTYSVRVDNPIVSPPGNYRLDNYLVPTGTNPPSSCLQSDPLCTTNPVPDLVVSKSSSPASTDSVNPGDTVSYQLTFDNSQGNAPAAVNWYDDMSGTLDDATLTGSITGTGGLLVGPLQPDDQFSVGGTVAAGQIDTVTYTVQVDNPIVSPPGNYRLDNYLVPTGSNPPSSCLDSNPLCTTNPVPDLVVTKSVDPATTTPVNEGQDLTYTLTFDNSKGQAAAGVDYKDDLAQVVDDATVTKDPAQASGGDPLTVGNIVANEFTIAGNVAAGDTATVTYTVRVNTPDLGNHRLDNYLVTTPSPVPTSCAANDPTCTTNPVPDLVVTKSVDPVSTTPVAEGDTLNYTVTFDNSNGQSPANVDFIDHLAKVLDDAKVTVDPVLATGTGLTVGAIQGDTFSITGTLAANATATVTYSVQVDAPDTGDHQLDNFVVPRGTPAPPTCQPSNELCTTNPDPALKVSKTVDPPSGTQVNPGDVLSYTLHFDNTAGKAAAPVQWTDDLSDLLDDATIVTNPALATGTGLKVGAIGSDDVFSITGSLPAGSKATVTYQVRVDNPDNGNGQLANYLKASDSNTPPSCDPNEQLCTINVTAHRPPTPAVTGLLVDPFLAVGLGTALLAGGLLLIIGGRRRRTAGQS